MLHNLVLECTGAGREQLVGSIGDKQIYQVSDRRQVLIGNGATRVAVIPARDK